MALPLFLRIRVESQSLFPQLASPFRCLFLHIPCLLYASLAGAPFLGQIRLHRLGVFGRVARRSEACQLNCHFFQLPLRLGCRKYATERDAEPEERWNPMSRRGAGLLCSLGPNSHCDMSQYLAYFGRVGISLSLH
ncbi:hypothetical protein TRIATDRAFT_297726 [Trichoderma atroviride IMI 206040]|uniref:Uncharacterized protein n=1 Tax=Hypocrea atroviridis (strain ATCC 20476 / IMI 206040) TaxID=452589 RepID=G9NJ99_HYPAI|nr:uncharacterized protein TRIATDRAFT_297726 [Trichoderma atroviride IMI 206040]EHK48974.1 hypothetical protein TRIATDRAFT_297726 [Trichoderma atroviride IMI 206040]